MRSVTRSEVKWLVNEVAALTGELERIDREIRDLSTRREALQRARQACLETMSLLDRPLAAPNSLTVQAHRSYGGRGKLRAFLLETITAAAPATVDTNQLALQAIEYFGLRFASPGEYFRFKNNSIGRALRKLERDGLIDRVGDIYAGATGFATWRLRPTQHTWGELLDSVAAATQQDNVEGR